MNPKKLIILNSAYDFYELDEEKRKDFVGKCFKEPKRDSLYFPLQLAFGEFNK